jgi:excisionase family DNA binding protein
VSLPQRSPAQALPRSAGYGQRPYTRPAVPGAGPTAQHPMPQRPMPQHPMAQHPMGQRPMALRPAGAQPMTGAPVAQRPAPRPAVSFLTVAEVAAIMRVSKMTVYRLVHGGELAAVRVGRSFRVPEPAVRAYLSGARTDVA